LSFAFLVFIQHRLYYALLKSLFLILLNTGSSIFLVRKLTADLATLVMTVFILDHPCVCREKLKNAPTITNIIGSPLRVQGKVKELIGKDAISGITPACAGKRWPFSLTAYH